jgi:hypothetical protein
VEVVADHLLGQELLEAAVVALVEMPMVLEAATVITDKDLPAAFQMPMLDQ